MERHTKSKPCLGAGCTKVLELPCDEHGRLLDPSSRFCKACRGVREYGERHGIHVVDLPRSHECMQPE